MPAGLQVFNTDNTIQIDENYRNLHLIASGQFTANNAVSSSDSWYTSLGGVWANTTPFAIMAVRCTSTNGLGLSAGSFRGTRKVCNYIYTRNLNTPFQYYIFDLVPPRAGNFGMQVFDAEGLLVFDATEYPMKIVRSLSFSGNAISPTTRTLVYTGPNSNIAFAATGGGYTWDADGEDLEKFYNMTYFTGAGLYSYAMYSFQESTQVGTYGRYEQSGVVVDISNLPLNYSRY